MNTWRLRFMLLLLLLVNASPLLARVPRSGIYAIWINNRTYLLDQPYVKGGQARVQWKDVDTAEETTGTPANKGNWGPLDSEMLPYKNRGIGATIQVNGGNKPTWLYNKIPYIPNYTADTQIYDPHTIMYWHSTHLNAYKDLIWDLRNYLVNTSGYANNIIGIRLNFNMVGTEKHSLYDVRNWDNTVAPHQNHDWYNPLGGGEVAGFPWSGSVVDPYKEAVEETYRDHMSSDIYVFARTGDVTNVRTVWGEPALTAGDVGWFYTSAEAEPRTDSMGSTIKNTFVKYCRDGLARGYTESWGDAWGYHSGKWDDDLEDPDFVHWCSPPQFFYWRILADLSAGVSYIAVYGDDLDIAYDGRYPRSYPAGYPAAATKWATGDVSAATGTHDYQTQFRAALDFANKYAGYNADGANTPGAWIAFRPLRKAREDYYFLLQRVGTDSTVGLSAKTTAGDDDIRYGAFARKLTVGDSVKLQVNNELAKGQFLSSLASQSAKIICTYLDSGTGTLNMYAGGQTFSVTLQNTGNWKSLTGTVTGTALANQDYGSGSHIKLAYTGSGGAQVTLHMVEVERVSSTAVYPTNWNRYALWSETDDDNPYNPGYNANNQGITGSAWTYDYVTNADGLGGANPWYRQSGTNLTWDSTNKDWDTNSGTAEPEVDELGPLHSNADSTRHSKVARVIWTAPESGRITISGVLKQNFLTDSSAKTSEWAIAKKVGAQYTLLASGSQSIATNEAASAPVTKSVDLTYDAYPRLTNIGLATGDQLIWTHRITATGGSNGVRLEDDQMGLVFTPGTIDTTAPANVTSFTATSGSLKIDLSWSNPTDSDFAGVRIQRSTSSAPADAWTGTTVYEGNGTSYSDSGLVSGATYYYAAFAFDGEPNYASGANASASPGVGADTAPAAPTALVGGASEDAEGDAQVNLDWANNDEPDLAGYNVYRSTVSGGSYTKLTSSGITASDYLDNPVTEGVTYFYVVTAYDAAGDPSSLESAYSAELVVNVPRDDNPPAAPTGLAATPGNGQVALDWNDNTDVDLVGYYVLRAETSGGPYELIATLATTSACTDLTVTNGRTYYYAVSAFDDADNESPLSSEVSALPADPTLPGAVTRFTATPASGQVTLSWTNPGDSDFGTVIVRRATGAYPTGPTNGTSVYSGTGTSATDSGLTNGTTYYYAAWAQDTSLNYSAAAAADTATPGATILTFYSTGSEDGWLQESSETSGTGGSFAANHTQDQGTRLGDNASDWQYRSIYSFDTSSIPDGVTILSAELKINRATLVGTNPFTTHGAGQADIRTGGFNGSSALEAADFQATASSTNVATMRDPGVDTCWSSGVLSSGGRSAVNKTGITQFRVYFATDDDDDATGDYLGFCPGEYSDATRQPKLVLTVSDATAPGTVTSFTATAAAIGNQVNLSWVNPGDADFAGVMIRSKTGSYPTGTADGTLVYDGTGTTASDTGLTDGTTYYYRAFPYDGVPNYNTTTSGQQVTGVPADTTNPGQVTSFAAAADPAGSKVNLSWANPTDADLAAVVVQRKTGSYPANAQDGTRIYEGTATSVSDTGLTDGTTYYYRAWAKDEVPLWSTYAQATCVPADTTAPGLVTNLNAAADPVGNKVNVSWTNPTDADFAGVDVRRKSGSYPTGPTDGANVYSGTGTSAVDSGLTDGTTYYYCVYSKDEVPNYSAAVQDTCVPADSTAPAVPTGLGATPGDTTVTLNWNANTDDTVGYNVWRATASGGTYSKINGAAVTLLTYQDTGRTNGTTYYYKISAVDEVTPTPNESALSGYVSATPADTTAPGAVTNLVIAGSSSGGNAVSITWTNPTAADFTTAVVRRKTGSYPTGPADGTSVYSGSGTSATDSGLTVGTMYYYGVYAADEVPNYSSAAQGRAIVFNSVAADDGWILETSETKNQGGSFNAALTEDEGTRVGDNASDCQYKSVFSFDTTTLPDADSVSNAELQLMCGAIIGTNAFSTHGQCRIDIRTGGFNGNVALEAADFQAAGTSTNVATMSNPGSVGSLSTGTLNGTGLSGINKTGKTQLKIYFATDDNDDTSGDYIGFYPGDNGTDSNRPKLIVSYY